MALSCFNIEMRLSSSQIEMIRHTAHLVLGDCARVTLFGSRVNDQAKGGDVDLMIEVLLAPIQYLSSNLARCLQGCESEWI